jgi:hypothetical protein
MAALVTYRGRHGHPRPASGHAGSPRPVVAAGLAAGLPPRRGHPGAAHRAVHRGGLDLRPAMADELVSGGVAGALGEAVAAGAAQPPYRVPRGARVHRHAPASAAHLRGGGDTAPASHRAPAEPGRDRGRRPLAGHLAPARLPPGGRPGGGGRRGRRRRGVAGGLGADLGVRLRVDGGAVEPARPRPVLTAARIHPAAARHPARRVPDRGRAAAAGGGAVAHRRGRGARRLGRASVAGPQPDAATGTPGGAPDPDPDRRRRRRRRRTAPAGTGPARRDPAAARRAGHEPGPGPGPRRNRR